MKIREIELGGYITFRRKPTLDETGKALEKVLNFICDDILRHTDVTIQISSIRVFNREPEYYANQSSFLDPLRSEVDDRTERRYTVACKAICKAVLRSEDSETVIFSTFKSILREGIEPDPLEENE